MKKVLCILAAVAMVAAVSTSCKKKCTCETYENGKVISTTTYELGNGVANCKAMSTYVEAGGESYGMQCK